MKHLSKRVGDYPHLRTTVFLCVFLTLMCYVIIAWNRQQWFDAGAYWNLVRSFRFTELPEWYRGYLFPYLIFLTKQGSDLMGLPEWTLYMVIINGAMAYVITRSLPVVILGGKSRFKEMSAYRYVIGCVLMLILTILFWGEYLMYSLSDMPAFIFCAMFIYYLILIKDTLNKEDNNLFELFILGFLVGTMAYACYNTRAVYMYGIIVTIVLFFICHIKQLLNSKFVVIAGLVLGIFILSWPQMIANNKYIGRTTPQVPTESFSGGDLIFWQVKTGLSVDRYETYCGKDPYVEGRGIYFYDNAGMSILSDVDETIITPAQFMKIFIRFPVDVVSIYIRHLINYFTPVWSQVYISDISVYSPFVIVGILLWLLFAYSLLIKKRDDVICYLKKESWVHIPFVMICLLMIPGAPEIRFFIAGYYLTYGYLCYRMDYLQVIESFKKRILTNTITILFIICVWLSILTGCLQNANSGAILIGW